MPAVNTGPKNATSAPPGSFAISGHDAPHPFTIDLTGNFMLVGNQRVDAVTSFRINKLTGETTFTGDYTPVGSPSAIVFRT